MFKSLLARPAHFVLVAVLSAPLVAVAQGYPTKPVRMIVPFAPGGATTG